MGCVQEREHTRRRDLLVGVLIFSLLPVQLLLSELSPPAMFLQAGCAFAYSENGMTFEGGLKIWNAWFLTVCLVTRLPLHLGQGHSTFGSGIVLS
jgi:hypothetical protein